MTDLQQTLQLALGDAFRIDSELPGGGMSRVFLATESSLNRTVVIKVLPPELTSEVSAARFKQEMEFAARLQHPHILPVLAAGARDGLLYYIMPFATGESLRRRMEREGRITMTDTLRLVNEIADALAFAHGHGIIHRDIKPENILLEGKHAVLTDFGIARALVESRTGERLTVTGIAVGTPGYMSPEQLAGDDIDARTDVYALAVVAYEMLAGAPPFTGPTAQSVLAAHLTQPPRPLHDVDATVSPALSAVISRALSKDVSDRFASASAFADALQAASPAPGGSGERAIESRTAPRPYRRRAAVALAIVFFAIFVSLQARQRSQSNARVARVSAAADSQNFDEVARLAGESSVNLTGSRFESLLPRVGGFLAVNSSPGTAAVTITRTTPVDSFARREPLLLGSTPVTGRALVRGEYLLRFTAPGYDTLALIVNVGIGDTTTVDAHLLETASYPGMVFVAGSDSIAPFLIGRFETTNAEFLRFIDDGGYRNATLWPETMVIGGRAVPREAALAQLVDASGLAGPRAWNAGRFPAGKENHPVSSVSWYEANAYARWAGGSLPTASQWWRAALGAGNLAVPWGDDASTIETRANFSLGGTTDVRAHPLGVGPFGAYDLAGNVAEWLADVMPPGSRRLVVGGSWNDQSYMFERNNARLFESGDGSDIIGFRIVKQAPAASR
jgi:serine/threonine protein kinase